MTKTLLKFQKKNATLYFLLLAFSVFFFLTPTPSFSVGYFFVFFLFCFFLKIFTLLNATLTTKFIKKRSETQRRAWKKRMGETEPKKGKRQSAPISAIVEEQKRAFAIEKIYASSVVFHSMPFFLLVALKPLVLETAVLRFFIFMLFLGYMIVKVAKRFYAKGYVSMEGYLLFQIFFLIIFVFCLPLSFFAIFLTTLVI